MLDKHQNPMCPREDEIVSYLYRQMSAGEIDRFESHLAECDNCVDDLAAVSVPHLEVYEWRTNVFDKIPAPSIELPIVREQQPPAESLLGRLSAVLSGWPARLRIGVAFTALLVVGLAMFVRTRSPGSSDLARNAELPRPQEAHETVVENPLPPAVELSAVTNANDRMNIHGDSTDTVRKAIRLKEPSKVRAKTSAVRTRQSEFAANQKEKTPTQRSIRLNNFEEDEDTTLRLAELFEEVGSL